MVQVIENRADIRGQLVAVKDDELRPGHKLATIDIQSVESVDSFPNLLGEAVGKTLDIVIPNDIVGSHQPGMLVRCRVRRTGPAGVFAESCSQTSG